MKVKEAEEIEAQKNSVLTWVVEGILGPTNVPKSHIPTKYDPSALLLPYTSNILEF